MRSRALCAFLVLLSVGLSASVQSQTEDPIQALKDSLTNGQQGSVLQGVLGSTDGTNKKTDKKLNTPETVQQKNSQQTTDLFEKANKEKTRDGRVLRQVNEDPELRADDTVLIEMSPVEEICERYGNVPGGQAANNGSNTNNGSTGSGALNGLGALTGGSGSSGISGIGALAGASGINGNNNANSNNSNNSYDLTRCPLPTAMPKTDQQKEDSEKFRKRILSNNPYKLNHFGVLELPGLPCGLHCCDSN
jgi:hypothetical protein